MSEQDSTISSESEDVEAHGRKKLVVNAADEPRDETESDQDDVELHGKKTVMASDERGDSESDDDVELHGRSKNKTL